MFLSVPELAKLVGYSDTTIRGMIEEGIIQAQRNQRGRSYYRIPQKALPNILTSVFDYSLADANDIIRRLANPV